MQYFGFEEGEALKPNVPPTPPNPADDSPQNMAELLELEGEFPDEEEILAVHLKTVGGDARKNELDWGVEIRPRGDKIWVRRKSVTTTSEGQPSRDDLKDEFFAKRHLYECVGHAGQGRIDTGELDLGGV